MGKSVSPEKNKKGGNSVAGGGIGKSGTAWNLPVVWSDDIGRLGPAFGFGAGCGIGVGVGLFGGAGIGLGFPGFHLGVGAGAGCGVGLGFGYGMGKGVAYYDKNRHSNVGKLLDGTDLPYRDQIGAAIDGITENTRKWFDATSRQMEKWR